MFKNTHCLDYPIRKFSNVKLFNYNLYVSNSLDNELLTNDENKKITSESRFHIRVLNIYSNKK